jgi:hypothetical protein
MKRRRKSCEGRDSADTRKFDIHPNPNITLLRLLSSHALSISNTDAPPSIPTAPLEVVLADELQDSLRRLKPEGNLLHDRMRNMIVNGKVESRREIAFHKQRKTTVTEKWSYKDWTLDKL